MSPLDGRPLILFVDDEPDVVEILAHAFERTYGVLTATSASEALELLQSRPIDLLVTDQKMPDMTGIDLVTRAREAGVDVTAILLTAYTDPQDLIDAINKGQVFRYVTKPWDATELSVTIKNALDQQFLRRERERLLAELKKRVDALDTLYEVGHAGEALASYDAVTGNLLQALARVVPYELAAALVALPGQAPSLQLHGRAPADEGALLAAKEAALREWESLTHERLAEDRVGVRVTGQSAPAGSQDLRPSNGRLAAPLTVDGRPIGVVVLLGEHPFTSDDEQILWLLANQSAQAIRSLAAAIGSERRRIERMVECMADGVILTDAKNEIVVINRAAREIIRLDPAQKATAKYLQERLGFYPFELVRGWEYAGAKALVEEVTIFDRSFQSIVSPVTEDRGGLAGVVVVLRDISEQKAIEARKAEIVNIVSHELRTPLTAISGALDLVLGAIAGEINDKQRRFLTMAKESTDRLNRVVDDLLDLGKFAGGKMKMSFEVLALDEQVRSASVRYQPAADEKGVTLTLAAPQGPVRVVGDPGRLGQVLNNLLTNAVKFTPKGGRIELGVQQPGGVGGFAVVSCWNSGEHIEDDELERIFEQFEQGRAARKGAVRGTGLGLSICRTIVEAHGGRIWAESAPGKGARFVVVLPLEPVPEAERVAAVRPSAGMVGGRPVSVLVVDDEPDITFILKALLVSRGFKVVVAGSAEDAIALARKARPDLVALDVRMPGHDGLSLAEALRHDPATRAVPLLVFSVSDERERAFQVGANAFLQKPLDVPRFIATVEGLLAQRPGAGSAKVLVVDDDDAIRDICSEVLENLGYRVLKAATVAAARELVKEHHPEVLLVDVVLPDGDGFSLLEEIKAERAARHVSVIFISARGETASKVRALRLGADDYLVKPFDAVELGARVETALRRREAELGASPTTGLPGSAAIEREVLRRFTAGERFGLCYLDLDNLKAYNDHYGYAKADGVVQQTGDLLREVVEFFGQPGDFIGHIAGDDFVFLTSVERIDGLCQRLIEAFDRVIPLYYDKDDRERGYIDAEDRYGQQRRFPVMSVSVAVLVNDGRYRDYADMARAAADLKKRAKAIPGSKFIRSDTEEVHPSTAKVRRVAGSSPAPEPGTDAA